MANGGAPTRGGKLREAIRLQLDKRLPVPSQYPRAYGAEWEMMLDDLVEGGIEALKEVLVERVMDEHQEVLKRLAE